MVVDPRWICFRGPGRFLPFIIITSFAVLNFFIGVIVDSMQTAQKLEAEALGVDDDAPLTQRDLRSWTPS